MDIMMALHINFLILFLLSTLLLVPLLPVLAARLNTWPLDMTFKTLLRWWLYFVLSLLCLRVVMGLILLFSHLDLYGVAKFYPIRIAYPNYDWQKGLPYTFLCLALTAGLPAFHYFLSGKRRIYVDWWAFCVVFLLCFGSIHGGFFAGNVGIANSTEHLHDASLNANIAQVFSTHTERIAGLLLPKYHAAHSSSHPAASIAYWQIMVHHTTPILFSVCNVLFFAFGMSFLYWALHRRVDPLTALQSTMACLFIPAMLIYGRADDAIFYSFTAMMMAFLSTAIIEKRLMFTFIAALFFVCAMNFSYAALVLLPALFAFQSALPMKKCLTYLRTLLPHFFIFMIVILVLLTTETRLTHFNWWEGFRVSAHYNAATNIIAMLRQKEYIRILNDRCMAVYDFLIFAGPLLFYLFVSLLKKAKREISDWQIKNAALLFLMVLLALNSNGPGEVSRPWGSLFLLIGFFWLPDLLQTMNHKTRWLVIQAELAFALVLQILLHFGW